MIQCNPHTTAEAYLQPWHMNKEGIWFLGGDFYFLILFFLMILPREFQPDTRARDSLNQPQTHNYNNISTEDTHLSVSTNVRRKPLSPRVYTSICALISGGPRLPKDFKNTHLHLELYPAPCWEQEKNARSHNLWTSSGYLLSPTSVEVM